MAGKIAFAAKDDSSGYPSRPIRCIVPFPPGGTTDILTRQITRPMSELLGVSIIVENISGAGGVIGTAAAARAPADGYTLTEGNIATHAISVILNPNAGYDPVRDFEPISLIAHIPNYLIVNSSIGVDSVPELIAYLSDNPAMRQYASAGVGTSPHLAGALFSRSLNIKLTHVPYKGSTPALTDIASGVIPFMFDQKTAALPFFKSGKVKLLAVTTDSRVPFDKDLPTLSEQGFPGLSVSSWHALYAPKGVPQAVVAKLNSCVLQALSQPEIIKQLTELYGMRVVGSTPDELKALTEAEIKRWRPILAENEIVSE
ncbi:tripartite tricarboxylate transporter substrate binding protein [Verticiella sediminum]|uniref:Tripartite tricarboxylate transporter substrate binding protein n=2 Tax=Verticiella sediminum TaxID=1247510 RepID=A0A556AKP0_9BURK|nr:tripartite tricarboxylate transporter substrate binding protein [Verticiella sediminum]